MKYQYDDYKIIDGPKRGIISNFFSALKHTTSDYTFFSDQDDIWLPNKIDIFLKFIQNYPCDKNTPQLFFSDARLIDSNENVMEESFFTYQGIDISVFSDDSIIYKNCVQGASCCINRTLRDLLVNSLDFINIKNLYMHDWWIALLAKYYGESYFINDQTLLYRQHDSNQIGVFNRNLKYIYYLKYFRKFFNNFKLAIRQMRELEKFHQIIPSAKLKPRKKRKYQYVPLIKKIILRIFRL